MEALIIGAVSELLGQGLDLVKLNQQKGLMRLDLRIKESLTYKSFFEKSQSRTFMIQMVILVAVFLYFMVISIIALVKRSK